MKKKALIFVLILILSVSGCGLLPLNMTNGNVETLKGWQFQYNSETNDYSLFFGLLNGNGKHIAANVNVDIRIVNDKDEEVYSATRTVTISDFSNYVSDAAGEQYLANVRVPASEIKAGKSSNGTVYLTVYNKAGVRFEEVNCSALYCLPVGDVEVVAKDLPVELKVKEYDGSTKSIIKITDVDYTYEKGIMQRLTITISGQKIYGNNSNYDIIGYKLYDSAGYLIYSGNIYLKPLGNGDKFRDDSINIYDITPGETYSLQLTEYGI